MAAFVDGETTVGEAREDDFEEAIERVTGLSLSTIVRSLRLILGYCCSCSSCDRKSHAHAHTRNVTPERLHSTRRACARRSSACSRG
jgi:hypothetical protein